MTNPSIRMLSLTQGPQANEVVSGGVAKGRWATVGLSRSSVRRVPSSSHSRVLSFASSSRRVRRVPLVLFRRTVALSSWTFHRSYSQKEASRAANRGWRLSAHRLVALSIQVP